MRSHKRVIWDLVQQWPAKVGRDLDAARILNDRLKSDFDVVGFHAQQAAEK